ncbi:12849_t:CDS:10 [Entrophospora sp. SA101]|nr:11184_t:CDS:10 [Entrophospora sp. SA101]CAJ0859115.1 12849_t:CDS:10 [Entrophospora sp. SA101]
MNSTSVVDLLDYTLLKDDLPRVIRIESIIKILPKISQSIISETDIEILKKIIIWNASMYPFIFESMCQNPVDASLLWDDVSLIKKQIMSFFDSEKTNEGIKLCAVKYLQVVARVQSRHMSDSTVKAESDISLSLCPPSHSILDIQALEKESISIVNGLLSFLDTESSIVITAMINAMGSILRSRPQYIQVLLNVVKVWCKNDMPKHFTELQLQSIKKTIKIHLISLLRIYESSPIMANEIFDCIILLGGKNDPSKFSRQFRRMVQQQQDNELLNGNLPKKLDQLKQEILEGEKNQSMVVDVEQEKSEILDPRLKSDVEEEEDYDEDKDVNMDMDKGKDEGKDENDQNDQKMEDREGGKQDDEDDEDEDLYKSEISKSPNFPSVVDMAKDGSEPNKLDNFDYEDEKMDYPVEEKNIKLDTEEKIIKSDEATYQYILPPPSTLSEEESHNFVKMALKNMLEVEGVIPADAKSNKRSSIVSTTLSSGKRFTKSQLHVMTSRLLTRGLETSMERRENLDELRDMKLQYIVEDFKNRMDYALTWLDEEWYHDSIMQNENSSYEPNYTKWLNRLLDRIMPALEDHTFTQFILDIPEIFEDVVNRIKIFCNDPDRMSLGFSTLSELVNLRPPARNFCLKILLAYCLYKDDKIRGHAIMVTNKWYPTHVSISRKIETFALESLRQLCNETPPPIFDFHYHFVDSKENLYKELLNIYVNTNESVKSMIRKYASKLVEIIGLNGLLETFQNFPDGTQDLVLRMLIVYTNNNVLPPKLVSTVKEVIAERDLDGRFLFPTIAYFEKEDILKHLPKVLLTLDASEKQRDLVKKVFHKILTPSHGSTNPTNSTVTPIELLVAIHKMSVPLKQLAEVLAAVLHNLSIMSEMPTLFMRTTISSFVNELLIRHINQIWDNDMLRKGFILYCAEFCLKIQSNNFSFLLALPKAHIIEVLSQQDPKLKNSLKEYIKSISTDTRRLEKEIPQYLIEYLNED